MRKHLPVIVAIGLLFNHMGATASQIDTASDTAQPPYTEVALHPKDTKKVYIFFSFGCSFSSSYDAAFNTWIKNMPRGWTASFVPVIDGTGASVVAAKAFHAVEMSDPSKLPSFMNRTFIAAQNQYQPLDSASTWKTIAKDVGLRNFGRGWSMVRKEQIFADAQKMQDYGVKSTPSIAIGGRYIISPDNTNGDQELFFKLANGMISKSIRGE